MMNLLQRARDRVRRSRHCLAFALLLTPIATIAQQPEALPKPDFRIWTSGAVNVVARMPDGGLIVGGAFTAVNGVARLNLARLLPDGSLDQQFNPRPNSTVGAVAVDASGAIYVGGAFSSIGGSNRDRIAKLAANGTLDAQWNPGASGTVNAFAFDGNGSVFVAGDFTFIAGTTRNHLAKLTTAGTGVADPNWNPNANQEVHAIAYDAGAGKLYIGGAFNSVGIDSRLFVARISSTGTGAADSWNPGGGGRVYALQFDGSGWLYAGGNFQTFGGQTHALLARVSTAGVVDAGWTPAASSGGGVVMSLALGSNALYVAGSFESINSQPQANIASVSTLDSGSLDTGFAPLVNDSINHVSTFGDGTVYIASSQLSYVSNNVRLGFAALNASGTPLPTANVMNPGTISALIPLADGSTLAGGNFYFSDTAQHSNLLKFDANGVVDPNWNPATDFRVNAMGIDAGATSLYIAGDFRHAQGQPRFGIAKFSIAGALDPLWNPAPDYSIYALTVAPDGTVYVGGNFQNIGGGPHSQIARLNSSDGSFVSGWNTQGANGPVGRFVIAPDGSVFVSGLFTSINGQTRRGLAKLDATSGAADASWSADLGTFEMMRSMLFSGGAIYVGGGFTQIAGVTRSNLAKISFAAPVVVDPTWTPTANSDVNVLVSGPGNTMFIAGDFNFVSGLLHRRLAKLSLLANGAVDDSWAPEVTAPGTLLNALLVNGAGNVVIGGYFDSLGGQPRQGIAALPPALPDLVFGNSFE
jgi:hypothetical protein